MELTFNNNPRSLFRKYWQLTTWFANTQLGRDYLKQDSFYIPQEKIALLLPNGYHIQRDETVFEAVITTRACYASRIYKGLRLIDNVLPWLSSFKEAQKVFLGALDLISWGEIPNVGRSIHFTTTDFNPDAHSETTSVDGSAGRLDIGGTWAAVRGGSGNRSADSASTANIPYLGGNVSSGLWDAIDRGFFLFDTSTVPDTDTIASATFSLYFTGKLDNATHNQSISIVNTTPASNTAIVDGDYANSGTTQQASDVDLGSISTGAYTNFALNVTGLGNISKTGISKFGTRLSGDRSNTEPSWAGAETYLTTTFADAGSNEPKLSVIYNALNPRVVNFL